MAPPPNILKIGNNYLADPSFKFRSVVNNPIYAGRHQYSKPSTKGTVNTFVPDMSVFIPGSYNRPNGYNMFNKFDPGTPNTKLDYSITPPTLNQLNYNRSQTDGFVRPSLPDSIPVNYQQIERVPVGQTKTPRIKNIRTNDRQLVRQGNRLIRQEERDKTAENRAYRNNVLINNIASQLRHYPVFDSINQYIEKKRDTPDMSDYQNAKNYALRPTNVLRANANHITGNLKFNPYDTTAQANTINAQVANGINTVSRQGSGKLNVLLNNISNMLSDSNTRIGNNYMAGWQANEKQRMAVAEANREADKFNAMADNEAENNYINARNTTALQDKKNAIDALNNYADKRYAINTAYENQLRGLRDQMVENLADEGRNAYDNNRTNTNKEFNYWYDLQGNMHYIPQQGGARYVEPHDQSPYYVADGDFSKLLAKYSDDKVEGNKAIRDELYQMMNTNGYARGRYDWYNKYKTA